MERFAFMRGQSFILKTLLLVILLVWPLLYQSGYAMRIMTTGGLFTILTIAVVIILGQAGQLSFGHSAFYGIGAYTAAILTIKADFPTLAALVIGALVAGIIALIVGRPVLKLRYFYLALATIGLGQIFLVLVQQLRSVTGSTTGLAPVPYAQHLRLRLQHQPTPVLPRLGGGGRDHLVRRPGTQVSGRPGASGHRHQRDRLPQPGGAHAQLEAPCLRGQRHHLRPGRRPLRLRQHGRHAQLFHLHRRHPPHRHDAPGWRDGVGLGDRRHPHDLGDQRVLERAAVQRGHLLRHHDPAPDLPACRPGPAAGPESPPEGPFQAGEAPGAGPVLGGGRSGRTLRPVHHLGGHAPGRLAGGRPRDRRSGDHHSGTGGRAGGAPRRGDLRAPAPRRPRPLRPLRRSESRR